MIPVPGNAYDAGLRKAAILVATLDEYAADLLMEQLGPDQAQRIRDAVMGLDEIDPQEQQRVIDEFRRIGPMLPSNSPPGIELDGLMTRQFASAGSQDSIENESADGDIRFLRVSDRFANSLPGNGAASDDGGNHPKATEDAGQPFGFLHDAEEENLAQLLTSERPQTIALVLSHLPAERAGDVLARFAPMQQVEVVRRLVDLENSDPETLHDVERALETRLSQQFAIRRTRAAGPDAVARILAACDHRVAGSILDNLASCDRPLAEQLGGHRLKFEDLAQLEDAVLRATFRAAEPEVIRAALLGATPEFLHRVYRCLLTAEAENLRRGLACPGPIRLSDIEDARQQIAALAQHLSHNMTRETALAA